MPAQAAPYSRQRNVLLFRSELLPYSEGFIPSQAEQFKTFVPYYAGFRRLTGAPLEPSRTLTSNSRKWAGSFRNHAAIFGIYDPWFRQGIEKIRPQIMHAHFEEGGVCLMGMARRWGVPLIVTCHGYDVTVDAMRWQGRPIFGNRYRTQRDALFRSGSLFLGVSRFICDTMVHRGYPAKKIRLHYIGVDSNRYRPDPSTPKKAQILFVGRLVEKKGCRDLLSALLKVRSSYPEIELAIVGDGAERENLEGFVREHQLNVRFLGVRPSDFILQALRESILFCLPSVRSATGDSEGLGIVNLEAQAVGLPVVGTRHGGIPEAVEDGVTGLLCDEHDPAALARNILTLLSDSSLRRKMGEAARERVLRDFDLKRQSYLLEDHYLEFM